MDITLGYLGKAYRYSSDYIDRTQYDFSNSVNSADTNFTVPDGPVYYNFIYPKNLEIIEMKQLEHDNPIVYNSTVYTASRPRNIALHAIIKYK